MESPGPHCSFRETIDRKLIVDDSMSILVVFRGFW